VTALVVLILIESETRHAKSPLITLYNMTEFDRYSFYKTDWNNCVNTMSQYLKRQKSGLTSLYNFNILFLQPLQITTHIQIMMYML